MLNPYDTPKFQEYNRSMENDICYLMARGLSRDEATQFIERLQAPPTVPISAIVETLEQCKHEHERGGCEGLDACLSISGKSCDCHADEINASIDMVIAEIQRHAAQAAQWREAIIRLTADNARMKGQIANLLHQDSVF